MIEKFVRRLNKIGVQVELVANYPWVYLTKVNGKPVIENYAANHGFTAFFLKGDNTFKFSDRRVVFNKIRELKTFQSKND